ncbi:MAG: serine/threonine protein kinase [Spirochaetae bacterium HGW-Spirochaetae-1]|jgi:serine/threonine-protein kinase|nr:MAG: serine/threonine protein kinase [Spirochaetae bacterium HGW-Spirochaetae-1]
MKTKVGKYTVTERIARGGMGEILKARHPTLNKDVILKRLTFNAKNSVIERFKREAQLQIDFRNDNIVQVFDHFKEGPSYYIVMEYVDGISLDALIEKNRYLPNEIALLIFYRIAGALKYAHDKDVIHRDIKPANVLISREGVVKLTDFGIATSKEFHDKYLTREMTLGTPAYMSPEQITDTRNVDKRADIYSMGVVLYEMVTGKCPYPGDISSENINRIQKGKYTRPSKVNPKVTSLTGRIIKKAMHHKIKKRYKDLEEIIRILSVQLKKYKSQEMIDETIRLFIQGKTADSKKSKKSKATASAISPVRSVLKIAAALCLFAAISAAIGFYVCKKGYHHEFYKADEFGALRAKIKINTAEKNGAARYIRGNLLVRGPQGYTPVENGVLEFTPGTMNEDKAAVAYTSARMYLPTGSYRLMVDIDNRIYQRDFFLKPRAVQKTEDEHYNARVITIDHTPLAAMPVSITCAVSDSSSGRIITDETNCFINYGGRWVKWQDFIDKPESKDFLVSGKKYIFNFTKTNYYNRTVSIDVLPHQAQIDIQAEIAPFPGILLIRSSEPDVEVLINNNPYYIEGGSTARIVKLDKLSPEVRRIVLPPNSYYITARKKGIIKTESIQINSTKNTRVIVNVNMENNTIEFNVF